MMVYTFLKSVVCPLRRPKDASPMQVAQPVRLAEQPCKVSPHGVQQQDQAVVGKDISSCELDSLLEKNECFAKQFSKCSTASTCSPLDISSTSSYSSSSSEASPSPSDTEEDQADVKPRQDKSKGPESVLAPRGSDIVGAGDVNLKVSANSWVARMQARRKIAEQDAEGASHEEIVRKVKSILNKLTVEKFPELSKQLISCISSSSHLEALTHEMFNKAIMQHHFVNMYADLCSVMHSEFANKDPNMNFKKILLNTCQACFESSIKPPENLQTLKGDEMEEAQHLYKARMIGNIKFVGALVVRKLLAIKILFAIIEDFLSDPTPEALESLAALLTVVGPNFDQPESAHQGMFQAIFDRVKVQCTDPHMKQRVRCLLTDVLELRASGWQDGKPKKLEAPATLQEVAQKYHTEVEAKNVSCSSMLKPVQASTLSTSHVQTSHHRPALTLTKPEQPKVPAPAVKRNEEVQLVRPVTDAFSPNRSGSKPESWQRSPSKPCPGGAGAPPKVCGKLDDMLRDFLKANSVDENAVNDLKDCPPQVMEMVLSEGEVMSAQNPSAKLRVRIKRAWREFHKQAKLAQAKTTKPTSGKKR